MRWCCWTSTLLSHYANVLQRLMHANLQAYKAQADLIVANRLEPALADVLEKVYSRDVLGKDT
jgi:hypothetical protein